MAHPTDLKYTASHEWVRVSGTTATIGITAFAQAQLGDLTFVELPALDEEVSVGDDIAVVESVKAASDVYAPVSGTVVEVNSQLESNPGLINSDPFGEGWIFKISLSQPSELDGMMDSSAYTEIAPAG